MSRPPFLASCLLAALALLAGSAFAAEPGPRATLARTLRGHTHGVFNVAFSPDGSLLATAGKDRAVKLWDAATGKELRTLAGHTEDVYAVAFSPDGKTLASAGADHTVRLWHVADGKPLRTLTGHTDACLNVAFSPDGRTLASAGQDHAVRLWDAADGKELRALVGHTHRVIGLAFSRDGSRLASSCPTSHTNTAQAGGEVKLWDVASGDELLNLPTRDTGVVTVAFSPDGKRLAGACLKRCVRVWELATGKESGSFAVHSREVYHVAFSPDGRLLASCAGQWDNDRPGEVKLWDLPADRELLSWQAHATPTWSLAFSPDGGRLATASGRWYRQEGGVALVWDLHGLPPAPRPTAPPDDARLKALWKDLSGADAARAYRAVWALRAAPAQAVPLLADRARPPDNPVGRQALALVAALDADSFPERERAMAQLAKIGPAARPALRAALASPSPEVRRRAAQLLEKKAEPACLCDDEVICLRAIEVLQTLGTPGATAALVKLRDAAPGSPVAEAAAAALRQFGKP